MLREVKRIIWGKTTFKNMDKEKGTLKQNCKMTKEALSGKIEQIS